MGLAAILVMWPGPLEQTFIPHPKKMFENVDGRTRGAKVICILLAHGSGELISNQVVIFIIAISFPPIGWINYKFSQV